MLAMRVEQAHSDARYGVEVSRGDPWASFFDLEWEEDEPRKVAARGDRPPAEDRPKRSFFKRKNKEESQSDDSAE
jgi:hypothetical protein